MKKFIFIVGLIFFSSCASFYEVHYNFNKEFESGEIHQALKTLRDDKKATKGTSRFLYNVNNGLLLSMMGKYNESNDYLERAFLFGEDYRINYAFEFASYLTNPQITVYRGEDHEHLMVLYYKALNFLKQSKYEEALVECRRLNIRLQQLSDKYTDENKYQRDAFVHNLMGIIYQASGDWNNAFIAYRNAIDIYENDYSKLFNLSVPHQLKVDVIQAAFMTGFEEEAEFFKEKFGIEDFNLLNPDGELVFFWHNGLSPVKDEFSVNFAINHGSENLFVFSEKYYGMSFPFKVDNRDDKSNLSDLEVFRVAFPRYVERPAYYSSAIVTMDSSVYELEKGEDVNAIAIHSLKQRMVTEFSKTLLRAALKKAAEHSLRKEDKALGSLLGLVNAFTEKADTRNWQTLPNSISYTRVPLNEGKNVAAFRTHSTSGEDEVHYFTYHVKKGQTLFHTFSSLESLPAQY